MRSREPGVFSGAESGLADVAFRGEDFLASGTAEEIFFFIPEIKAENQDR